MCTNVALVDSLECYMDELVESFQDFVKKSLFIITVALGSLIGLLFYILKLVKQRNDNFAFGNMSAHEMNMQRMTDQGISNQAGQNLSVTSGTDPKNGAILKSSGNDPKSDSSVDNSNAPRRRCCNLSCGQSTPISTNYAISQDVKFSKELELRNVGLSSCSANCIAVSNQSDRPSSKVTIPSLPICDPKCKSRNPSGAISNIAYVNKSCCSMCCDEQT